MEGGGNSTQSAHGGVIGGSSSNNSGSGCRGGSSDGVMKKRVSFDPNCKVEIIPSHDGMNRAEHNANWVQKIEIQIATRDSQKIGAALETLTRRDRSPTSNHEVMLLEGISNSHSSRGLEDYSIPDVCDKINEDKDNVVNEILSEQKRQSLKGEYDPMALARIETLGSRRAEWWAKVKAERDAKDAEQIHGGIFPSRSQADVLLHEVNGCPNSRNHKFGGFPFFRLKKIQEKDPNIDIHHLLSTTMVMEYRLLEQEAHRARSRY